MKDALEATGYSELRDYQRKTIEAYLSGKDVFVSAPTGAGKSLTFELAPYTFDHLFGEACNAIVFVIVPLISLMKDQVSNLNSRGIRASYVGDDCSEEQLEDILNLKEKVVFGSPKAILNNYPYFSSPKTKYKMCLPRQFEAFSHSMKLPNKGFVLVSTVLIQNIC